MDRVKRPFDEEQLLEQAGAALGGVRLGCRRVIRGDSRFPRYVVRCTVEHPSGELPDTVIVKQANWPGLVLAEWIALEFLNALPAIADRSLVPRLFGSDRENELIVVEDLGIDSLGVILHDRDAAHARALLLATVQTLATIHAATTGQEALYREIRARIVPHPSWGTLDNQLNRAVESFPKQAANLGLSLEAGIVQDLEDILVVLNQPGPFRGFAQGDLNPGNILEREGCACLCDFVPSAYYNIFTEGVYPLMFYLAHGDIHRYPEELTEEMFAEYLRTLGGQVPAALDPAAVGTSVVAASAAWMAHILSQLPEYMRADRRRGVFTYRQSMLYCLDAYSAAAHRFGSFLHLAELTAEMSCRLKRDWSLEYTEVPLCRAFECDVSLLTN